MKEQYNKLLRHSSMQQRKIDSMQKTMESIVKNLGTLSKVVDRLDGIEDQPSLVSPHDENSPAGRPTVSPNIISTTTTPSFASKPSYDTVEFTAEDYVTEPVEDVLNEPTASVYRDCLDVYNKGNNDSDIYALTLPSGDPLNVRCDLGEKSDSPGWIIIQQRKYGQVDFRRDWKDYKTGFGTNDGDFWLGLEPLYEITKGRKFELRIDMTDWSMNDAVAVYNQFSIGPESDNFRLHISGYSGSAGDSLSWHNNMPFTTKDRDNDPFIRNCAHYQNAGWWFNMCAHSNLNGVYYSGGKYKRDYNDGIYWSEWKGSTYSLKYVEMKVRPAR